MSQFPSMPLFAGDMLADTEHLTNEEFGVYHRLLYAMWRRNGWVPDDDVDLARICHCGTRAWQRLKPRMMQFLIRNEAGELSQKKLLKIRKLVEQKSAAAQQSARQRWGSDSKENNNMADADGYANAMHRARDSKSKSKKEDLSSDMLAPSFRATLMNGSAAIGPSPGFEGRYGPTPSKLTQELVARGLHKP